MKAPRVVIALLALAITAGARAESSWPFWDRYAARFITHDGRVVDPDRDSMTTSEGQAYAMFFALVANDRPTFETLRSWTEDNLSYGDLNTSLPSWSWGRDEAGGWRVLDPNSASDADLWMAYSLLQAGTLWKEPQYSHTGQALLGQIARQEVAVLPGIGPVLLPGKNGFHPAADRWMLNPSYLPLPILLGVDHSNPAGPWKKISEALPSWLAAASPRGYAMDWVEYVDGHGFTAWTGPGNTSSQARGSYDAIRVYLWAGVAPKAMPGQEKTIRTFAAMCRLLRMNPVPPESIAADGTVSDTPGPAGFSAALYPLLRSSGETLTADEQLRRVTLKFNHHTGLLGTPAHYYDQNLALFALGWQQQLFQFAPDGTLRVRWKK
jgi:endo-1,4-beta-D-glucanase Y